MQVFGKCERLPAPTVFFSASRPVEAEGEDKKGTQAFKTCVPEDCVTLYRCQVTAGELDADAEVLFQSVHNAIPFLVRFSVLEGFLRGTHGQTEGKIAA